MQNSAWHSGNTWMSPLLSLFYSIDSLLAEHVNEGFQSNRCLSSFLQKAMEQSELLHLFFPFSRWTAQWYPQEGRVLLQKKSVALENQWRLQFLIFPTQNLQPTLTTAHRFRQSWGQPPFIRTKRQKTRGLHLFSKAFLFKAKLFEVPKINHLQSIPHIFINSEMF